MYIGRRQEDGKCFASVSQVFASVWQVKVLAWTCQSLAWTCEGLAKVLPKSYERRSVPTHYAQRISDKHKKSQRRSSADFCCLVRLSGGRSDSNRRLEVSPILPAAEILWYWMWIIYIFHRIRVKFCFVPILSRNKAIKITDFQSVSSVLFSPFLRSKSGVFVLSFQRAQQEKKSLTVFCI